MYRSLVILSLAAWLVGQAETAYASGVEASVPEPSTLALLGIAGAGLVVRTWRARRSQPK